MIFLSLVLLSCSFSTAFDGPLKGFEYPTCSEIGEVIINKSSIRIMYPKNFSFRDVNGKWFLNEDYCVVNGISVYAACKDVVK